MTIDTAALPETSLRTYDVCVIGGGAAGIHRDTRRLARTHVPHEPVDAGLPDYLSCHIRIEAAPDPENRVTLDHQDRDALGMPRARLTFRMGTLETRTLSRAMDLLTTSFGERSSGRVRRDFSDDAAAVAFGDPPWRGLQYGSHHIGTTA